MKKTGMVEFSHMDDNADSPSISDQFNEWFMNESADCPDLKVTHINTIAHRNTKNQGFETMFIVYEYVITQ